MSHRLITLGIESAAAFGVLLSIYIRVSAPDGERAPEAVDRESRFAPPQSMNDQSMVSPMARRLSAPDSTPEEDLVVLSEMFEYYCLGNDGQIPTGTNLEITQAFIRKDSLGLAFIGADHTSISSAGELVDRWGSPYVFHAQSSQRMEVRSAGPDRQMHTMDDFVWPEAGEVDELSCPQFCYETQMCLFTGTDL
jgi:hypothetical protein